MSEPTNSSYNSALMDPVFQAAFNARLIQLVAPGSGTSPEKIEDLKTLTELTIDIPATLMKEHISYHANSDEERFNLLEKALYNPSPEAIVWTLRGGYGSARLIGRLLKLPPPAQEKIFIGFSDNTALHLFLSQHWHWKTIHGAGLAQLLNPDQDPLNFIKIAEIVLNKMKTQIISPLIPMNNAAKSSTSIKGQVTGGNLTLVENSIGTPWQINTRDKIVFLEEVGEKGYRVDRSLLHLSQANLLKGVKAIVFGQVTNKPNNEDIPIALKRFANELTIPVYQTDKIGHGNTNYPIVFNKMSEIIPVENYAELRN